MKREEFIETLVEIDVQEDGTFGHYPFQAIAKNSEGKLTMAALALGGDVKSCYQALRKLWREEGNEIVHMSIDFPAIGDIDTDFVFVVTIENDALSALAIPYNPENGKISEYITESKTLSDIITQCGSIVMKT